MVKLTREKQDGGAWETVVEAGGGGSQDLAQVLVAGGDPDGNPITGAVTISPSGDVEALGIYGADGSTGNLLSAYSYDTPDPAYVFGIGPAGAVIIRPSDPAAIALSIAAGVDTSDTIGFQMYGTENAVVFWSPNQGFQVEAGAASTTAFKVRASTQDRFEITADGEIGFFNATPVAQPTGVAVSAAGIHAALVTLGLITA